MWHSFLLCHKIQSALQGISYCYFYISFNFRCIYIDKIVYLIDKAGAGVKMEEDEGIFDTYKVRLRLAQADSARSQENFIVALKQQSQTHGVRFIISFPLPNR